MSADTLRCGKGVRGVVLLLLGVSAASSALGQVTRHVAACGNDAWTGLTASCVAPNGPKRTIQAAINASASADTVLVADGTYTGAGNRNLDFGGRNIILRSRNGPAKTILDAQASVADPHRVFILHQGETRAARIEGFTVTRGRVTYAAGGGMLLDNASPTVINCVFRKNGGLYPPVSGGAVASIGGDPLFEACRFFENQSDYDGFGGAVMIDGGGATLRRCVFADQVAGFGGAVHTSDATIQLIACNLASNSTYFSGGALQCVNSNVTVTRCALEGNAADRCGAVLSLNSNLRIFSSLIRSNDSFLTGGAIHSSGTLVMRACRVLGNTLSTSGGGAIAAEGTMTLSECLIAGNRANPGAGAIYAPEAVAAIRGCTITGNGPTPDGAAVWLSPSASIANSIIWGNDALSPVLGNPVIRYSVIEGGYPGTGNVDTDPLFSGPQFRLAAGSPCIDAGSNPHVPAAVALDLDGKARFRNDAWMPDTGVGPAPVVDMGAFEFIGTSCRADCNMDGALNTADFTCFNTRFMQSAPYADFNRDGSFTAADFDAFNAAFAAGCP